MIDGVSISCIGVGTGGRGYKNYVGMVLKIGSRRLPKTLIVSNRVRFLLACIEYLKFLFPRIKCSMLLFACIDRFMFLFADVSPKVNGVLVPGAKKENFELELKVITNVLAFECG